MRLLLVTLAALLALTGCADTSSRGLTPSPSSTPSPTPYKPPVYAYEVEGVATDATVTLSLIHI